MRRALPAALLAFVATAATAATQDRPEPRFRIGLGFGGGTFDYETDRSNLEGDTDAGMFRLSFEATSGSGIGGGVRFESTVSDDDLFVDAGFPATEATHGNVFGHFTYRLQTHRFAMPMRAGLLFDDLTLEEQSSDGEIEYLSVGPYFEVAPEVVLVHGKSVQWSLFGEFGLGFGGTSVELGGDTSGAPRDYDSFTSFFGVELGTRVQLGPVELGLSYVARWQSMDESDPEGGFVVLPYDADFQGLLLGVAVVF